MRSPEQERQFHLERSTAIGGSDVGDLVGDSIEGCCTRRLWYDKKGVPADFPFKGNRHTRRGEVLEPIAAAEFAAGERFVLVTPSAWILHPSASYIGVHLDATLCPADRYHGDDPAGQHELGILEVKCPSSRVWYEWRAGGPSLKARLQLQWGMMCSRLTWGYITAFNADLWDYDRWRIERDDDMQGDLFTLASKFWPSLQEDENPWPKLDAVDNPTCRKCPWRRTCQGINKDWIPEDRDPGSRIEVIESDDLVESVSNFLAAKQVADAANEAVELARAELRENIGERTIKVRTSAGTVTSSLVVRKERVQTVKESRYYPAAGDPREGGVGWRKN
jgi:hypothetical protein